MLVGLVGYKGSGKGEAAKTILADASWRLVKFADPLKAMLRTLLAQSGLDTETIERMIEGDLKETPAPELNGQTPRHAMQTLGTEWGRNLISQTLWIDTFKRRVRGLMAFGFNVVVDDCRFLNEAAAIKFLGGGLIYVDRAGLVVDKQHPSEQEIEQIAVDYTVGNHSSVEALHEKTLKAITHIWRNA